MSANWFPFSGLQNQIRVDGRDLSQPEYPLDDRSKIVVRQARIGCHRDLPPDSRSAIPHLLGQRLLDVFLPAILRGDVPERWTDHLRVDGVTRRAGVLLEHAFDARAP